MTDRLQEAERIVRAWKARIERLRAEVAANGATEHRTEALARAEVGLSDAQDRLARLRRPRRVPAKKLAKLQPLKESLMARATAIAAAASRVKKRWKDERAKEPKRVKARAKELQKRTTKDLRTTDNPLRRRRKQALGLPEAATWPTGPIVPVTVPLPLAADEPPRPGLLPGEYVVGDRAQRIIGQLIDTGRRLPKAWTWEHVGDRLVEAFRTLRRLPMNVRPKEFGSTWPEYLFDTGDGVQQAISGTLQERNRVILGTSADDVSRMSEALAWPMEFLGHDARLAAAVNEWACWNDFDDVELDSFAIEGLKAIADGLNRKNVVVR